MSDIVERLRHPLQDDWYTIMCEAAEEIERLRVSNALLKASVIEHEDEIEQLRRSVESFEADKEFHKARAEKIHRQEDEIRDLKAEIERLRAENTTMQNFLANMLSAHLALKYQEAIDRIVEDLQTELAGKIK